MIAPISKASPGRGSPSIRCAQLSFFSGLSGASYLTALHHLIAGKYSTATQVIAVIVFVIIEFLLIIIPFAFLELRPQATKAGLKRAQAWLTGHVLQLMVAIALLLGAYLTISALVRLS